MKRYFIEEAKFGESEGGISCGPVSGSLIATVKYTESGKTQWLSMAEYDGFPNFYLADKDIHDELVKEDLEDENFVDYTNSLAIDEFDGVQIGGEYEDLFAVLSEDPENPAVDLIRYLIALIRCDEDDLEGLIQMAKGKYADEIDIPVSDVEQEWIDDNEVDELEIELPEDMGKEELFRLRLGLETDIATESVYHDLDEDEFRAEKAKLHAVICKCRNDGEYEAWKDAFISSEYEKIKDKKFITCVYMFAGIGQYEITIPAEEKDNFIRWIDGNGSAFYGGERDATEDEIKQYIALNA